jgi:hypothetical protein
MASLDIGRDQSGHVGIVLKPVLKGLPVDSLFIYAHRTSHYIPR